MISYREFKRVNESTTPSPVDGVMDDIAKEIDALFEKLKDSVHQMTTPKRGWIDDVRGKWWNLFYGSNRNPNHPEYRRNIPTTAERPAASTGRIGEDGAWRGESYRIKGKMTLLEYRQVESIFSDLENNVRSALINETHAYKIDDMIDAYKERLKQSLKTYVQRVVSSMPPASPDTGVPPVPPASSTPPDPPASSVPPAPPATSTPPDPPATTVPPGPPATSVPPAPPATSTPPDPPATTVPPAPPGTSAPPPPATSVPPVPPATSVPPAPPGTTAPDAAARGKGRPKGSKNKTRIDPATLQGEDLDIINGMIAKEAETIFGGEGSTISDDEMLRVRGWIHSRAKKGDLNLAALSPEDRAEYIRLGRENAQKIADLSVSAPPSVSPGEEGAEEAPETENVPDPPPATTAAPPPAPAQEPHAELKARLFPHGMPTPPGHEPKEAQLVAMKPEEFKYFIIHDDPDIPEAYWIPKDRRMSYEKEKGEDWRNNWTDKWWTGQMRKDFTHDYLVNAHIRHNAKKKRATTGESTIGFKVEHYRNLLRQEHRPERLIREAATIPFSDRVKFYVEKLRQKQA